MLTFDDLLTLTAEETSGQKTSLWLALDCPFGGNWVIQTYKERSKSKKIFHDMLIDSSTDQYNKPDWLQYSIGNVDYASPVSYRSYPISYNTNFPSVVWPDKTTQAIPCPNKVYEWVDNETHRIIFVDEIED